MFLFYFVRCSCEESQNMSMFSSDLKSLFTISIKTRYDSLSDQFNRIFMVKLLLVSTVIMAVSWYQDDVHCIVPGKLR